MSSIVTFNVRGIRERKKRRSVFRHLHVSYPNSIISLQETHSSMLDEKQWEMEWGGDIYFSHGKENARGVAFLFPRNNNFEIKVMYSGEEGRLLILEASSDTHEMTLAGVYAPSGSRQEDKCNFLDRVERQLHVSSNHTLVMCGDMNIKLGARDTSTTFQLTRACTRLKMLMAEFDLIDVWRRRFPGTRKYTWKKTSSFFTRTSIFLREKFHFTK